MHNVYWLLPSTYFRIMSPIAVSKYTASALGYTAIASVEQGPELKRKFTNSNGSFDITYPILLFPCRPEYVQV